MPFWSGEKLKEEVKNCITSPYDADNGIDCAAYTLHVGGEAFVTPDQYHDNPNNKTKESLTVEKPFNIPSGMFAFLQTEEIVKVPNNSIAFISMKAKMKFKGLVNVSGFHVDPGYQGRLIFSVYNAGPMPIMLEVGMPLFLIWYADLDRSSEKVKNEKPMLNLPLEIVNPIHGPIFSPQSISISVKEFKDEIIEKLHSEKQDLYKELGEHKENVSKRLTRIYMVIGAATMVITILLSPLKDILFNTERKITTTSSITETVKPEDETKLTEKHEKPEYKSKEF